MAPLGNQRIGLQDHKMIIQPMFPIPLGCNTIDKALNKKIRECIKNKEYNFIKNGGGGGNSGTTDFNVLDSDELSEVKQVLTDSVNEYFTNITTPGRDVKLYITNSWMNLNENGESHHFHKHQNSIVSAVLYIDVYEGDSISFTNVRHDLFGNFIFSIGGEPSSWIAPEWDVHPTNDTLLMFPSNLQHRVKPRPNTCRGKRISLSFNTWFKGTIGVPSLANQLCL